MPVDRVPLSWLVATAVVAVAAVTDLRWGKVPNELTYGAALLGIGAAAVNAELGSALSGFGVALALSCLLYAMRSIGGGDVKLLAALGALIGYPVIWDVLFYSIVCGAALSLGVLIARGRLLETLRGLYYLVVSLPVRGAPKIVPAGDLRVPFAVAIAVGTVWSLYATNFRITVLLDEWVRR